MTASTGYMWMCVGDYLSIGADSNQLLPHLASKWMDRNNLYEGLSHNFDFGGAVDAHVYQLLFIPRFMPDDRIYGRHLDVCLTLFTYRRWFWLTTPIFSFELLAPDPEAQGRAIFIGAQYIDAHIYILFLSRICTHDNCIYGLRVDVWWIPPANRKESRSPSPIFSFQLYVGVVQALPELSRIY